MSSCKTSSCEPHFLWIIVIPSSLNIVPVKSLGAPAFIVFVFVLAVFHPIVIDFKAIKEYISNKASTKRNVQHHTQ